MAYLPVAMRNLGTADLTVGQISLAEDVANAGQYLVSAKLTNRGIVQSEAEGALQFTDQSGLLGEQALPALSPGESRVISLPVDSAPVGNITATIVYPGAECDVLNNAAQGLAVSIAVEDQGGLSDTQDYVLNILDVNDRPLFDDLPSFSSIIERDYFILDLDATDPDAGDTLEYFVVSGPLDLDVNFATGVVFWQPELGDAGLHDVVIGVRDLAGEQDLASFVIDVAANRPPVADPTVPA